MQFNLVAVLTVIVLGCWRVSTLPFRTSTVGVVLLGFLGFEGTEVFSFV
jgi:hypothetical protein